MEFISLAISIVVLVWAMVSHFRTTRLENNIKYALGEIRDIYSELNSYNYRNNILYNDVNGLNISFDYILQIIKPLIREDVELYKKSRNLECDFHIILKDCVLIHFDDRSITLSELFSEVEKIKNIQKNCCPKKEETEND